MQVEMVTKPDSVVMRVREAAISGRRSTLYMWLARHYDEFQSALDDAGKPNWQAIAEALGEAGLTDLQKKPPSAKGTRATWLKVKLARSKLEKRPSRQPSSRFPTPIPVKQADPFPSDPNPESDDQGVQLRFVTKSPGKGQ